jgi:hypothetical protein
LIILNSSIAKKSIIKKSPLGEVAEVSPQRAGRRKEERSN